MQASDREFWYSLDHHLPQAEFENKVRMRQGYILMLDDKPAGLLRYQLFWDNTPFCTMLFIEEKYQKKRYGKQLMEYWEKDMKKQGYGMVLTSTRADENAQHFYRKLGYKDCGGFVGKISWRRQGERIFACEGAGNLHAPTSERTTKNESSQAHWASLNLCRLTAARLSW